MGFLREYVPRRMKKALEDGAFNKEGNTLKIPASARIILRCKQIENSQEISNYLPKSNILVDLESSSEFLARFNWLSFLDGNRLSEKLGSRISI